MKRLLAILCVLACLCALCVPAMATEADNVRIYAYVPGDWTEAYLYVWKGVGGDGEVPTGWPGVKMDVEGDGWYSAEVPGDMTYAIVNNGNGVQTADLDILSGIDEWIVVAGDMSAEVFYEEPTADDLPSGDSTTKPAGSVVVHAQIPADWAEAYLYSWIKDGMGPAWPGDAMTKDGDWWVGNIDAANNQVIISNNGTPQTIDLTVEAGKEAWVVVTEAGADGKFLADVYHQDPAEGGEPITPDVPAVPSTPEIPENASFYVAGVAALCGEDWNPGAEANKMTVGASGLYEKTFENVPAGSYALKVTIGNWDLSWGGDGADGNYEFTMDAAGSVTVKFDAETQTVTVETTGSAVQQPDPTEPSATEPQATKPAATDAPTEAPATNDGNAPAEQPKDNTALIIIIFVVVSAGAIGGALLYKKKKQ